MKRKYADRRDWQRILQKTYRQMSVDEEGFQGTISVVRLEKIREPLYVQYGEDRICIVDQGYMWLQHISETAHYAMTTMFNERMQPVQWYFDIARGVGMTEEGVPCFDDLYLDVIVLPGKEPILLDEDELEEALRLKEILPEDYRLARREAAQLMNRIREGGHPWIARCGNDLRRLLDGMEAGPR